MTFRDFAQGAWRMRGIGFGQTLTLLIPPEVANLVEKNARQSRSLGFGDRLFGRNKENNLSLNNNVPLNNNMMMIDRLDGLTQHLKSRNTHQDLSEVCAWLVIKGIESESIQLRLLSEHNLFNVWRKNAFNHLCNSHSEVLLLFS